MDITRVTERHPDSLAGCLQRPFLVLQRTFEYPDILRKPTDYVLDRFQKGGPSLGCDLVWLHADHRTVCAACCHDAPGPQGG